MRGEPSAAVLKFLRDLNRGRSLAEIARTVLRYAMQVVPGAQSGTLLVLNAALGVFEYAAAEGWDMDALSRIRIPKDRLIQRQLPQDRPAVIRDPLARNRALLGEGLAEDVAAAGPLAVFLSLPVRDGDDVIAYLNLDNHEDPEAFSGQELGELDLVWEEITLAVRAARERKQLTESEEQFRLLFEHLSDAAFLMSPDTTIVAANPAAEHQTGYSRNELMGRNVLRDLAVAPSNDTLEALGERFRQQDGAIVELEKRRKDGSTFWTECRVVPLEYRGAPALMSVSRDVTARKCLEQALATRLAALESLAHAAPGIARSQDQQEVVQRIVSAAREIAGADHANLLLFSPTGDHIDTFDPEGAPRIPIQIRPRGFSRWILDTGQPLAIDTIHPDGRSTPAIADRTGKRIRASKALLEAGIRSLMGFPVQLSGGRRAILYVHCRQPRQTAGLVPVLGLLASQAGAMLDNARLVEELHASEAGQRALFDHSPISLWIEDFSEVARDLESLRAEGVTDLAAFLEGNPDRIRDLLTRLRVLDVNRATLDLYGARDREDILARIPQIIPEEAHSLLAAQLQAIWEGRTEFDGEGTNRNVDGRHLHIRLVWRTLPGHEKTYDRVLVSALDITERVEAERAAQRRDAVLMAVAFVAEQFLRDASFDEAVHLALARLGEAAGADRVYVFQEHEDGRGSPLVSQRHEWVAPGVVPQIDNADLQNLPYTEAGFGRWREAFLRGDVICGLVESFPEGERAFLGAQGILSIAVVPIRTQGKLWGFMGFDECVHGHHWTTAEVEALRAAADAFGAALQRAELEKTIRDRQAKLEGLFEVSVAVGRGLDLEGVFAGLYSEIQRLIPCDAFVLALVDTSRNEIRLAFGIEDGARLPELVRPLDPQTSLTAWVACEKKPLLIRDAEAERDRLPAAAVQIGKAVRSWLGVPLIAQEKVVGVVSVQTFAAHAYSEDSLRLLLTASVPVAAAIRNAWTYAGLAELERKLRAVEDVSQRMQLAPDKAALYSIVLDMTRSVLGHEQCAILEPRGQELVVAAAHDEVVWARGLRVQVDGKGLTAAAARALEAVYVPDVSADSRYVQGNEDTRCELALPLAVGGQVLGVLDVQKDEVDSISVQDRELLKIVASELAVALAGLEKMARLETLSTKLSRLHDVSRLLTRCASDEEICQVAVRGMTEVLGFEHIIIGLGRGDALVPAAWAGSILSRPQTFRKGEGVAGKTWLTGESAWGNLERFAEARPADPRIEAFISVPIGSVGVVQVISPRPDAFTAEDVTLVEILSRDLFEEIRRVQLERELREQAIRDPLTDLYNRRFLSEVLAREIERAKRYGHPMTLIMADVDDFKLVNDRYGHVVGDAALRSVAVLLQASVRAGDFVFRYGGEEFVVVLPETGNGGGDALGRLREKMTGISLPDVPGLTVSVSLGYVVWEPSRGEPATLEDLLRQADEVLYEIKSRRGGR